MTPSLRRKSVSMQVTPDGFVARFAQLAVAEPDRPFARWGGSTIRFGTLDGQSAAVAAHLHDLGISAGSRVVVMLRNGPAALAVIWALARAGAVWVPVNVQQRGEGLGYILDHAEPALIITEADLLPVIRASGAAPRPTVVHGGDGTERELEAMLAGRRHQFPRPPSAEDVCGIMYTSGTTGPPKGVVVTHRMMRLAGEAVALVSDVRDGDVMLLWEPLYHIGGAQVILVPLLSHVTLAMVPRFSASRFWTAAAESGATHMHHLGGILQMLLKQPAAPHDRGHRVRITWGGGCTSETWREFERRFGVQIRECYGMTEAASITTINDRGVVGAVGQPVPWFDVSVQRVDGAAAGPGERGEIVVRSRTQGALFPGYFCNPAATARALRGNALHTGDLGSWDNDGNLLFHGRLTDSVRCRGENVSAWEVERVAATHPAVEECAMIGVPSELGEQDIKLFIRPRAEATIAEQALADWLAARLAPYQCPRYIALVAAFERTASERIMKHRLSTRRDDCWDRQAAR